MNELRQIADILKGIDRESMMMAEQRIAAVLIAAGIAKWEANEHHEFFLVIC